MRALGGLLPFIRPYRLQVGLAAAFLVLAAVTTLLFPVALKVLIDQGLVAADPGERVMALRIKGLHDKARENLRPLRLPNVHLLLGDGMLGYARGAPYAAIIAAAGGEAIPAAWTDQLAVGGRIVAPMVTASGTQALVVVERTERGLVQKLLEAVHFVPLKSGIA